MGLLKSISSKALPSRKKSIPSASAPDPGALNRGFDAQPESPPRAAPPTPLPKPSAQAKLVADAVEYEKVKNQSAINRAKAAQQEEDQQAELEQVIFDDEVIETTAATPAEAAAESSPTPKSAPKSAPKAANTLAAQQLVPSYGGFDASYQGHHAYSDASPPSNSTAKKPPTPERVPDGPKPKLGYQGFDDSHGPGWGDVHKTPPVSPQSLSRVTSRSGATPTSLSRQASGTGASPLSLSRQASGSGASPLSLSRQPSGTSPKTSPKMMPTPGSSRPAPSPSVSRQPSQSSPALEALDAAKAILAAEAAPEAKAVAVPEVVTPSAAPEDASEEWRLQKLETAAEEGRLLQTRQKLEMEDAIEAAREELEAARASESKRTGTPERAAVSSPPQTTGAEAMSAAMAEAQAEGEKIAEAAIEAALILAMVNEASGTASGTASGSGTASASPTKLQQTPPSQPPPPTPPKAVPAASPAETLVRPMATPAPASKAAPPPPQASPAAPAKAATPPAPPKELTPAPAPAAKPASPPLTKTPSAGGLGGGAMAEAMQLSETPSPAGMGRGLTSHAFEPTAVVGNGAAEVVTPSAAIEDPSEQWRLQKLERGVSSHSTDRKGSPPVGSSGSALKPSSATPQPLVRQGSSSASKSSASKAPAAAAKKQTEETEAALAEALGAQIAATALASAIAVTPSSSAATIAASSIAASSTSPASPGLAGGSGSVTSPGAPSPAPAPPPRRVRDVRVSAHGTAPGAQTLTVAAPAPAASAPKSAAPAAADGTSKKSASSQAAGEVDEVDELTRLYEAAATRVQARTRGLLARGKTGLLSSSAEARMRWHRGADLATGRLTEKELMAEGHAANDRLDYAAARLNFQAAYELGSHHIAAQLSAANMALKLGEAELALFEYQQMLLRKDLVGWHRFSVVQKLVAASVALKRKELEQRPWHEQQWHELIVGSALSSEEEVARSINVMDAHVDPKPPKPSAANPNITPIHTVMVAPPVSMPYSSLAAWQRERLPAPAHAYPAGSDPHESHLELWQLEELGVPDSKLRAARRKRSGPGTRSSLTPAMLLVLLCGLLASLASSIARSDRLAAAKAKAVLGSSADPVGKPGARKVARWVLRA